MARVGKPTSSTSHMPSVPAMARVGPTMRKTPVVIDVVENDSPNRSKALRLRLSSCLYPNSERTSSSETGRSAVAVAAVSPAHVLSPLIGRGVIGGAASPLPATRGAAPRREATSLVVVLSRVNGWRIGRTAVIQVAGRHLGSAWAPHRWPRTSCSISEAGRLGPASARRPCACGRPRICSPRPGPPAGSASTAPTP